MKKLSTELVTPWMTKILEAPTLSRRVRDNIESILPQPTEQTSVASGDDSLAKKRRYCC